MKAERFIKAGIVAVSVVVIGIIASGPELFFPVLLLAGIALCIRWLVASALSDWGFMDLTIKAFVVCFLIFVLGRPIFMIFELRRDANLHRGPPFPPPLPDGSWPPC